MDEYDELYGVSGGNSDSYYGNQDIYGDDQDNSQSYDPEKATLYSNQPNKAEDQSQQEKSDNNTTYDQQQQYYGGDADNTRDAPQQREYDQTNEQDQSNQSVGGQEEHESHPSVASAANQDEGKMFVGGLNWETTDERLRDYFSKFGEVLDCVVMRDSATGKSRGFAFLTFADSRVVDDVASRPHQLDGKNIDPKRAVPRDEQDKTEKIFVGGIHQDVDEEEFRDYFSQFGKVIDVTLMTDRATGRPRGFGFVTFESSQGVDNALHMTGLAMRGKPVEVKKAMPKHRQQQQSQGGDSHGGVAVNPYFNMYGKQGGSRYAGAANSMAGGNQGGRGGWYGGGAGGAGGNNGGMYGNYYGGGAGGNYPQNYQMMAAAAAAYYNRYMGYYQQQQQQQSNYDQGSYQDDSYEEGNDGGNDYSDQDRGSGGDQYSSGGQNDRYNDGGRGNHSRDPRRDPRSSSSSYSSGNDRNSRGNSSSGGGGGGGAVYASQSNRNHHNYRPY